MAQMNSFNLQRLIRQRDKAYEQLQFNEVYPGVLKAAFEKETSRQLKKLEYKAQKRLFPLELAATDASVKAPELRQQAMAEFCSKQSLPRRAVQQTYLRILKKKGQAQADSWKKQRLEKLDAQYSAYEAELKKKYPLEAAPPSAKSKSAYLDAQKAADKALEAFLKKRAEMEKTKLTAVEQKLGVQNESLRKSFTGYNNQILAINHSAGYQMEESSILSLRDVKMHFSGVKAVDGLSFDVKKGEIFGLIGPNGAGKSTLFNCITQFYRPTAGKIYYRDHFEDPVDLTGYQVHNIVRTGIARTFQNLELILNISVMDNLLVGAHTFFCASLFDQFLHSKRMRDEEAVNKTRALEVLERLDLLPYKDLPPAGLPYGILKRVELARTLMTRPRMIILDEPAAGLNDSETEELAESIRRIRDDFHCTIFLVEHDMNLVMGICDTVCAISFGKMLDIGTPEQIQNSPAVQTAYLGESEEEEVS